MEEVAPDGKNNWKSISKKVKKSIVDCMEMYRMLESYAKLGKTKTVTVNGVKIIKCPPAYCRGVNPARNVGQKS